MKIFVKISIFAVLFDFLLYIPLDSSLFDMHNVFHITILVFYKCEKLGTGSAISKATS